MDKKTKKSKLMKIKFTRALLIGTLYTTLTGNVAAQLPAWGDYPHWPKTLAAPANANDFLPLADLSQPAVREWQRQQTALTLKILAGLEEVRDFKQTLNTLAQNQPVLAQALTWQQQQFYTESGADGRCRVIVRQLPVGNERTLFVCEPEQQLLGFRLAADASLLALLLQTQTGKPVQLKRVVQLLKVRDSMQLGVAVPTASQHPDEIMPLPAAAGVLYRPLADAGSKTRLAPLYWHRSGDELANDKPAFAQKIWPARIVMKNAPDSQKLSLALFLPNQAYPQIWLMDLSKWQADKPGFNWQRRFSAPDQVRDLSFDEKALYWISAAKDGLGTLRQQEWASGSAVKTLSLTPKTALWQIHASDGKLWLHTIAQGRSQLVKYDVSKQQSVSLDLPWAGRLSELAGTLPGFMLESVQQAPLAYQVGADDTLKNWDIARAMPAPVEVSQQLHTLTDFPGYQVRLLFKRGLAFDGKRAVILMAEEVNQLQQLPHFTAQWSAWLARDGVLAWVQSTEQLKPRKTPPKQSKNTVVAATMPVVCQALLAASDALQRLSVAKASSQFLWERSAAPACWWNLLQQAPERFAAIASNQIPVLYPPKQNQPQAQALRAGNYPALLLSLDAKTPLQQQLNFMPVLGQLQRNNQNTNRPMLMRSEVLGQWQAMPDSSLAEEWGFFGWRYRDEQTRAKR